MHMGPVQCVMCKEEGRSFMLVDRQDLSQHLAACVRPCPYDGCEKTFSSKEKSLDGHVRRHKKSLDN